MEMADISRNHSAEFDVDVNIDDLIGRIVDGKGTPADRTRLEELIAQRSRLMRRDSSATHTYRRRYA